MTTIFLNFRQYFQIIDANHCRCYTRMLFVRIILLAYKNCNNKYMYLFVYRKARKVMKSSFFFQSIRRRYPSLHHFAICFLNFQRNVHSSRFDDIRFARWRFMLFVFLLTLQPSHRFLPISLFSTFHLDRHFVYHFQNKEKSKPRKEREQYSNFYNFPFFVLNCCLLFFSCYFYAWVIFQTGTL